MVVYDVRVHGFGILDHKELHGSQLALAYVEQINKMRVCPVFGDDKLHVSRGLLDVHAEITMAASELRLLLDATSRAATEPRPLFFVRANEIMCWAK